MGISFITSRPQVTKFSPDPVVLAEHRQAVLRITAQYLHKVLQLPECARVERVRYDDDRDEVAIRVSCPHLPNVEVGVELPQVHNWTETVTHGTFIWENPNQPGDLLQEEVALVTYHWPDLEGNRGQG